MNLKQSSAFSITKGPRKTIDQMNDFNKITPGPIYNVTKFQQPQKTISYSLGKSQRYQINHGVKQTPSPDQYNIKQCGKQPIMNSIPQATRIISKHQNPDPSCYNPNLSYGKPSVITYGLGSRYPSILQCNNSNPGPGDYQNIQPLPILTKSKSQKPLTFGTSSRFRYEYAQTPGVGNYQIISHKLSQQKFKSNSNLGKAKRLSFKQDTGPGPQAYKKPSFTQQNIKQNKGKSMLKKFEESILSKVSTTSNAFNKYYDNPQAVFVDKQKNPKYSFGKQNRQSIIYMNNPSPVQYINNSFLMKNNRGALADLTRHSQYEPHKGKPGPGTYQLLHKPQIQYSFPRSKSLMLKNQIPGAGRYDPKPLEKIKVSHFSKQSKFQTYNKSNIVEVGVGQYDINRSSIGQFDISKSDNQNIKFARSDRFKQKFDRSPGPGYYQTNGLVGNKSILKSK